MRAKATAYDEHVSSVEEALPDLPDKPTTGEVCGFTGDTIPTTGEQFTEKYVRDAYEESGPKWLADAINAALAAKHKEGFQYGYSEGCKDSDAALAAERVKAERYRLDTLKLDGQLATERERLNATFKDMASQIDQLRNQLAAAYKKGMEDEYERLRKTNCLDIKAE